MKRKIKYLSLLALGLIVAFGICVFVFKDKIVIHYRPEIKQVGTIYINMKGDTSYINSKLEIRNKSFIKIGLDTIKYKIALFDKTYLQSTEALGIKLPGYGKDTIDFLVKIPHRSLMHGIRTERKKGDSAGYQINVSLQISTPVWSGEIPFNKTAKLKIPTPPELELVEIKYKKVRLRLIVADVKIKITNHTNVVLSVKDMAYKMKISKQGDVKGEYKKEIHLKPKGTTIITLPMEISVNHIGKIVRDVLRDKDNYDYTLSMNAVIESISPVKESFHVELLKSGQMELRK
ncbi:MAG: LEA type 2 family protein [Sphingobacteriaceae bacterium]|nr:LEA type 2 family protein [Sphingobacteriaceae bacterium]